MKKKELLDSWKEISNYLNKSQRALSRWEKELGLPINRFDENSTRSKVFAYKSEIDQWLREKTNKREINRKASKNPEYQSPASLFPNELSIVVFPIENINSSEWNDRFSVGITNEIIGNICSLNNIKVISSLSVSQHKKTELVFAKLGANYFLKGKVEKHKDKFRLQVRLIRTKDERIIWKSEYSEKMKNIFAVVKDICLKIRDALNIPMDQNLSFPSNDYMGSNSYLRGSYILNELKEDNSNPQNLCTKGNYYWNMNMKEPNEMAINLFCKAIEINRNCVQAYIGLANSYINYIKFEWNFDLEWLKKAKILLKEAQTISPNLPEYFSALIELNLIESVKLNKNTRKIAFDLSYRGIKKYPNHPRLNSILGFCHYLKFGEEGNKEDFNKALEFKEKSFWLDPFNLDNLVYTEMLMLSEDFFRALGICNKLLRHNLSQRAKFRLGEIYYYMGELDKSKAIFQQFETPFRYKINSMLFLGMIASQRQEREVARKIAKKISIIMPEFYEKELKLASIYMGMGEDELGNKYLRSFFHAPSNRKKRFIYHKYIDIDQNFYKSKQGIKMRSYDENSNKKAANDIPNSAAEKY